ncbi:MAG: response regulator transcription factor [Dehalococcoidia bacterium]|nr:response regulator transcription factor [Dehalococcoidia bacterium]
MEKITILLADDHAVLREGMRRLLEQHKDMVVLAEAADGEQAVKLVAEVLPNVVLMDIVMPGLNGVEATKLIKKQNPGTAVLILTAYEDERYILGLLEAGVAGYLLKSATGEEIVKAIRAVHAGESVLHPTVMAKLLARAARSFTELTPQPGKSELTEREMSVLQLAARGMSNKELAQQLNLAMPTIKSHLVNIFNKMGVASRTEAVLLALKKGWVRL